jgi:hypothetical protein
MKNKPGQLSRTENASPIAELRLLLCIFREQGGLTLLRIEQHARDQMRPFLLGILILFVTASANAQLCGPDVKHTTRRVEGKSTLETSVPPDTAIVYVIAPTSESGPHYQVKTSVDRKWIGINQNHTYFVAAIEPGKHDFCAKYRNDLGHLSLTLEAGKTYFIRQDLGIGVSWRALPALQEVSQEDAIAMLKKCKLMEFAEKK